jgi:hypothetical protein
MGGSDYRTGGGSAYGRAALGVAEVRRERSVGAVSGHKLESQGCCLRRQVSEAMSIGIDHQLNAISNS